jgi:capsular polysaccharide transport system permease protein
MTDGKGTPRLSADSTAAGEAGPAVKFPAALAAARQLIVKGDKSGALTKLKPLLESSEPDPARLTQLAEALAAAGAADLAELAATRAVETQPSIWRAAVVLAGLLRSRGEGRASSDVLRTALEKTSPSLVELRVEWDRAQRAGKFDEAAELLDAAYSKFPDDLEVQYKLIYALHKDGQIERAVQRIDDFSGKNPENPAFLTLSAYILFQRKEYDKAAQAFQTLVRIEPGTQKHAQSLVAVLAASERYEEALEAIQQLLAREGDSEDLLFQAASLARKCGRNTEAEVLLVRAANLHPDHSIALVILSDLLSNMDRPGDALEAISRAAKLEPRNARLENMRLALLRKVESDESGLPPVAAGVRLRPLPLSRDHDYLVASAEGRARFRLLQSLAIQLRVIWVLTQREIRMRQTQSSIGIVFSLLEPAVHIMAVWVVMSMFKVGHPPLGNHWFFFYATGVIPFLVASHLASKGLQGQLGMRNLFNVPIIRPIDTVIAAALAELILTGMIGVIIFGILYYFDIFHGTSNFASVAGAFLMMWLLGIALMMINIALSSALPLWPKIWMILYRVLYFGSGIFNLAQLMPEYLRNFMIWNPFLIGIEWFRNGFYDRYDPPWLDRGYMATVIFVLFMMGIVAIQSFDRSRAD